MSLRDDPTPFWRTMTFWSAVLMVGAYIAKRVWGLIITPEEQSALVSLILELIMLCGVGGVLTGTVRAFRR